MPAETLSYTISQNDEALARQAIPIQERVSERNDALIPGLGKANEVFTAKDGDTLIAALWAVDTQIVLPDGNSCTSKEISYLVDPDYQQSGVGSKLVEEYCQFAKENAIEYLSGQVIPGSASERILLKNGFQLLEDIPKVNRKRYYLHLTG